MFTKPYMDESVIFLHLPKTAGTTLHTIISRHYRQEQIFGLGAVVQERIRELAKMEPSRRADIRLLHGHMGHGLHPYLAPPVSYLTLLREPVSRIVSFYYFVRRNNAHYLHDFTMARDLDLKELMESRVSFVLDNAQTRLLSGVWDKVAYGECSAEMLEIAKQNLRRDFAVVGLTERFDETLLLLRQRYGWSKLFYMRLNVTSNRPKTAAIDQDAIEAVKKYNQLDIALYDFADQLFEQQLSQQGSSFPRQLARFKFANRFAAQLFSANHKIKQFSARTFIRERWQQLQG